MAITAREKLKVNAGDVRRASRILYGKTWCVAGLIKGCENEPYTFKQLSRGVDVELLANSDNGRVRAVADFLRCENEQQITNDRL